MQNKLFGWILSNGGIISKIQISTGPDPAWSIRGLFATQNIIRGETFLSLPPDLRICASNLCDIVDTLSNEFKKGRNDTYWAPYIAVINEYDPDIPAVWSEEELSLLHGLYPFDWTRHTNWFVNNCHGDMNDPSAVRAMVMAIARTHGMNDKACMSPVFDLLSHDTIKHNIDIEFNNDVMYVRAGINIAAGEQLFLSYGDQNVGRFLRDYGFLNPRPHRWEFLDSQHRVVSFVIVEKTDDTLWIDSNPDRHFYQRNIQNYKAEVFRQLEYLLTHLPTPTDNMKPERVKMALTYRQEFIRSLELLYEHLEMHTARAEF
jgi:hypothetical protein